MGEADERRWTLAGATGGARATCARGRSARSEQAERLVLDARAGADEAARQRVDARIQDVVSRWAREIEALGAEVKGVWLVDFDNGSGYYCWRWPERELDHFHGYDDGFAGRSRIQ